MPASLRTDSIHTYRVPNPVCGTCHGEGRTAIDVNGREGPASEVLAAAFPDPIERAISGDTQDCSECTDGVRCFVCEEAPHCWADFPDSDAIPMETSVSGKTPALACSPRCVGFYFTDGLDLRRTLELHAALSGWCEENPGHEWAEELRSLVAQTRLLCRRSAA